LARIATDYLDKPADGLEYWTDHGWTKEVKPGEAKIIFRSAFPK